MILWLKGLAQIKELELCPGDVRYFASNPMGRLFSAAARIQHGR